MTDTTATLYRSGVYDLHDDSTLLFEETVAAR